MWMEYYDHIQRIEQLWKETKASGFSPRGKDALWATCIEGRLLFAAEARKLKREGLSIPPKVPAYERAIMLLEHEERWADALRMAKSALDAGISNDWYQKRIAKYEKLLPKPEGSSTAEAEEAKG